MTPRVYITGINHLAMNKTTNVYRALLAVSQIHT